MGKIICITGIDTDIGKTIVTGLFARYLLNRGYDVITQKFCQTGCRGLSEDILAHRRIMGIELQQEDLSGLTCPYIFAEPCSPHLAARLENAVIDPCVIEAATAELAASHDFVLLEGVGGLMVPILPELLLADYLRHKNYFHLLVSSSRLGSINHTLAALEILKARDLRLLGIVYNRYLDVGAEMAADSRNCFAGFMKRYGFVQDIVDVAKAGEEDKETCPDFGVFLDNLERMAGKSCGK